MHKCYFRLLYLDRELTEPLDGSHSIIEAPAGARELQALAPIFSDRVKERWAVVARVALPAGFWPIWYRQTRLSLGNDGVLRGWHTVMGRAAGVAATADSLQIEGLLLRIGENPGMPGTMAVEVLPPQLIDPLAIQHQILHGGGR